MQKYKEHRKEQARKRKNFLPTLILTLFLWLALAFLVYFFDPQTLGLIYLFFILLFFAFLFTFSIILGSSRRGAIIAISLILFAILRYLGIGNVLNLILIAGVAIVSEIYFLKR